jgi:AAA15 family ATPase/GTPase
MAVKQNHTLMLQKLKKQVRELQKKEETAKKKLKIALAKIRKLSKSYKIKLDSKIRMVKGKMAEAEASSYAKTAIHLERQILKGIETKGKAIALALNKIEKKYAAKLSKSISRKGKVKKSRKTAIAKTNRKTK